MADSKVELPVNIPSEEEAKITRIVASALMLADTSAGPILTSEIVAQKLASIAVRTVRELQKAADLSRNTRPSAGGVRDWQTLAIGAGALLDQYEMHMQVKTGKVGQAHVTEGKELREAGKKMAALIKAVVNDAALPAQEGWRTRPKEFLAWAVRTFGSVANDPVERACRFGEEAIELLHAAGLERDRVQKLIERVYSRPSGNLRIEVGQAQATLETFAEINGWNADEEAGREFHRVQSIPQEEWDRRHKAKIEIGIAVSLPERGR